MEYKTKLYGYVLGETVWTLCRMDEHCQCKS